MAATPQTISDTDQELEMILTSFDSNYVWNYGSVKEGLRELYEKAKREQWNSVTQLDWAIDVDPESEIIPAQMNPFADYGPAQKLNDKEMIRLSHAGISNQLSQFLHGEQGALIVASQLVGSVCNLRINPRVTKEIIVETPCGVQQIIVVEF